MDYKLYPIKIILYKTIEPLTYFVDLLRLRTLLHDGFSLLTMENATAIDCFLVGNLPSLIIFLILFETNP